jgi:hypothetical protein
MFFSLIFLSQAFLSLVSADCTTPNKGQKPVTVGAFRRDVWLYNHPEYTESRWNHEALAYPRWSDRWPFYAKFNSTMSVLSLDSATQEVMDKEIELAAGALDYWAFLDNPSEPSMSECFELYLKSKKNHLINFAIILQNKAGQTDPWYNSLKKYVGYFKRSNYQKVTVNNIENRPLVFVYRALASIAPHFGRLDQMALDAGLNKPYYIVVPFKESSAKMFASYIDADALSSYGVSSQASSMIGNPFSDLAAKVTDRWASLARPSDLRPEGFKVVPIVMTGSDARPLGLHYNRHKTDTNENWKTQNPVLHIETPTPVEIALEIKKAELYVNTNCNASGARTILVNAWNEFTLGGWLAPTYYRKGPGYNDKRLRYIEAIRKGKCLPFNSELLGDWTLDTLDDSSDYSRPIYCDNIPKHVPIKATNKHKKALEFPGYQSCHVNHHSSLEGMKTLTLTFTFMPYKIPDGRGDATLIRKPFAYSLTLGLDGKILFSVYVQPPGSSQLEQLSLASEKIEINNWYLIIATYDGKCISMNINNKEYNGGCVKQKYPIAATPLNEQNDYNEVALNIGSEELSGKVARVRITGTKDTVVGANVICKK